MPTERTPDPSPEIFDVMCDPVRWRAYLLLRALGPLRARQLAQSAGTSEGTMIRNLKRMQQVGFVAEVDDQSGKQSRFRPWRAIPGGVRLSGLETEVDQDTMARWMRVYVETQMVFLRDWAEQEHTWPPEWRESVLNYDYWLRLTLEEVSSMSRELHAVTEKYASLARERDSDEGTEAVYATTNLFPIKRPYEH